MNKQNVDKIITEYLSKIYGFAAKKSFSYDEAEELASDIVHEVYNSLLKAEEVVNVEGYIWRISEHTYSKYVMQKKKMQGVSIDGMEIPVMDEYFVDSNDEEIVSLRREIAFLSTTRRKIVYSFYFENKTIKSISEELDIPEGTVKWHLNKARNELKEGFLMERKIGRLGLNPKELIGFSHNGSPGTNGGPEYYFSDKLNLNIVYSVYYEPKSREEIAEELGVTPVFIEDKIDYLVANGFLVPLSGGKYTTYVQFSPENPSLELEDRIRDVKMQVAKMLVEEYVPLVRDAVEKIDNVYIPSGNKELLLATAIWAGMLYKCSTGSNVDMSRYYVKTLDGGEYITSVDLKSEPADKGYKSRYASCDYWSCGVMNRASDKYPAICSWSMDTRYCSRVGAWENNWNCDYEYIYELVKGDIVEDVVNAEKFARLRERKFINEENKINIMMYKGAKKDFFEKLPKIPADLLKKMSELALENAMMEAKFYPPQMQDLVVFYNVECFPENEVALMVMDILYGNGTFKELTEEEKITSQLIMFSDVIPE